MLGRDRRAIPPFASLRAFEAVGRLGGIRKAALELSVDHAVVSRHLRALEGWLGEVLFDRSASVPRLNDIGRVYHAAVSEALMDLARATRDVVGTAKGERLLIWCVPGFASRWLAANLDEFAHLHPGIEVELRPTDDSPDFAADEADADIRFVRDIAGLSPPPGVDWLRFARPLVYPVASQEWVDTNPQVREPRDLLDQKLLHEESDQEWQAWFHAQSIQPSSRLLGPRLWHAHLTLDAARRSQGVSLANPFLIARDIANGLLVPALPGPDNAGAAIGSYIFAVREHGLSRPAIVKFRKWIARRAEIFLAEPLVAAG